MHKTNASLSFSHAKENTNLDKETHEEKFMTQQQNKPPTPGWNAWKEPVKEDVNTRCIMRTLQGVQSSTTLGMSLCTHLQNSSRHTPLQLNINGLQEALSCYSTPIKYSLMHIHTHTHGSAFILLGVLTTPCDSCMLRDLLQGEPNLFRLDGVMVEGGSLKKKRSLS